MDANLIATAPFSKLTVARELPPAGHYTDRASALFESLVGSQIVECGAPNGEPRIEGGGFVIDFVPQGSKEVRRVVFGFNDRGMWVEYDGPV